MAEGADTSDLQLLLVDAPRLNEAVQFYTQTFGALEVRRGYKLKRKRDQEEGNRFTFIELRIGSTSLMLVSDNSLHIEPVFYFETDDVDAAVAKAVSAGAVYEGEIPSRCGGHIGMVKDPYQNSWMICPPVAKPPNPQPFPWLVYSHGLYRDQQTFYCILDQRYHVVKVPQMCHNDICFSDHGWLLLQDYMTSRYSLLNLAKMDQVIQLPNLPMLLFPYNFIILTSSPASNPNSQIMFIEVYSERLIVSCHPGDDYFVKRKFMIDDACLEALTCIDGKLYGLLYPSFCLAVADITVGGNIHFQRVITDESLGTKIDLYKAKAKCYLMEHGHKVLFVWVESGCYNVVTDTRIFLADPSTRAWEEVFNIDEQHAIFFDQTRGFFLPVSGIRGNCIYYTQKGRRSLFTYPLEADGYIVTPACALSAAYNSEQPGYAGDSIWILIPDTN